MARSMHWTTCMTTPTKSSSVLAFLPVLFTTSAVIVGATIAFFYGAAAFALYASILPFPLILAWTGRDVEAPIERIERADAERARTKMRRAPDAEQLARAA